MRKALVETATGNVVNVVVVDDAANWQPPLGCFVVPSEVASPGDSYDGVKFTSPSPVPQPKKTFPIIEVMNAVIQSRGFLPLTPAERAAAEKAISGG